MTDTFVLRWPRILAAAATGMLAVAVLLVWPLSQGQAAATPAAAAVPLRLFVGVDLAKLPESERLVFTEAETDFARVLKGLLPLCKAQPDEGYSDGGTAVYECKHYRLIVMHQLFRLKNGDGYLYGPQLTFRESEQTVSDVRYYTGAQLSLLLKPSTNAEKAP